MNARNNYLMNTLVLVSTDTDMARKSVGYLDLRFSVRALTPPILNRNLARLVVLFLFFLSRRPSVLPTAYLPTYLPIFLPSFLFSFFFFFFLSFLRILPQKTPRQASAFSSTRIWRITSLNIDTPRATLSFGNSDNFCATSKHIDGYREFRGE